jgi:hypothetical protein
MGSWWKFGESSGYPGNELALYRVQCPFCEEQGNFETVATLEKSAKASGKVLHYDTLKCGNCGNLTFVLAQRTLGSFVSLEISDTGVLERQTKLAKSSRFLAE